MTKSKELGRRSISINSALLVGGTLVLLGILQISLDTDLTTIRSNEASAARAAISTTTTTSSTDNPPATEEVSSPSHADDDSQQLAQQQWYLRKLRDTVYSERWKDAQQQKNGHRVRYCPWTTSHKQRTDNTRCDLHLLFQRLIARIPFSYVHFNDGEIDAMMHSTGQTDRGMQTLSKQLQQVMLQAFQREGSGLVFGIPCPTEFKRQSEFAVRTLHNSSVERTLATVFINGNYQDSKTEYLRRNPDRNVHLVASDASNVIAFQEQTGLELKTITYVPSKNAFPTAYESLIHKTEHQLPGDIVILCAGPLGRILAVEWFLQRPETTYLEMGSYFDQELLGKSLGARYYNMSAKVPHCGSSLRIQRDVFLALINATATDALL